MAKRILVTGAATGFGRGTSLALAKRGHTVIAGVQIAPQVTELMKIADEAGVQLKIQVLDITDEGDRQAAFANEVDVLINNAGVMQTGPAAEIPMENVRRNFETNVFGTLALTQGFARQMVKRGSGKIVMVTSMGGLITVPFAGVYCATKHALEALAGLEGGARGHGRGGVHGEPRCLRHRFQRSRRGDDDALVRHDQIADPPRGADGGCDGPREPARPAVDDRRVRADRGGGWVEVPECGAARDG